jgi:HEAT repeat protein
MNERIATIIKAWRESNVTKKQELIREVVKTGSPDGLKLLSQIVTREADIEIRQSARKAYNSLYKYCYPGHEEQTGSTSTKEQISEESLQSWLSSQDPEQEMKALLALQTDPNQEMLDLLRQTYQEFFDDRVKATLVKTLGMQGEARDVPICYTFLEDESPRVRANAIEALELINHPNTYMIFVQWLSDSDNRVKANCIKALRKLGQQSVNRILEEMLHSEYTAYKESALYVISLSPSKQGLYLLQGFLASEFDPSLVERAVHVIHSFAESGVPGSQEYLDEYYGSNEYQEIEDPSLVSFDPRDLQSEDPEVILRALSRVLENQYIDMGPMMVELLQTHKEDFQVCSYVIRILGELEMGEYLGQIIPFLKSEDDRVRANAVEAVGRMGKGVEYLGSFLEDRNNRVRANAVVAMGGKVDVSQAVLVMAQHENPLFRRSALYSIKQLKSPTLLDALESLIHDTEVSIRNQALEILQFYEICGIAGSTDILQQQGQSLYE